MYKEGDLVWYLGSVAGHNTKMAPGLYIYKELAQGRNAGMSFWDSHVLSYSWTSPDGKTGHFGVFQVDGCNIRPATPAERILYGSKT